MIEIDASKIEIKNDSVFANGYRLKTADIIIYSCTNCGSLEQQRFGRRERFLRGEFLCPKCIIEKNSMEKHGVKDPRSSKKTKEKRMQTMKERYGVENPYQSEKVKKKIRQTNLERYGVDNPSRSKKIKEKIDYNVDTARSNRKKTLLERYGVDNPAKVPEFTQKMKDTKFMKYGKYFTNQEKTKQTNLKRYGVDNPSKSEKIKEKIKQTNLEKHGVEHVLQSDEVRNKISLSRFKHTYSSFSHTRLNKLVSPLFSSFEYRGITQKYPWKCNTCGTEFEDHLDDGKIPRCPTCFPKLSGYSNQEKEIVAWLQSLNYEIEENNKTILNGKELDIYIPNYKLAIEYNGCYWHSIEFTEKSYHQDKVRICYNKGIRLLHIWEDDWLLNLENEKEKILYYINTKEEIKPREPILEERIGFKIWT